MAAAPIATGAPAITGSSSFLYSSPFSLKASSTSHRRPTGRRPATIRCVSSPPAVDTYCQEKSSSFVEVP
nr:unnamed protein product [Digitaria exilis]